MFIVVLGFVWRWAVYVAQPNNYLLDLISTFGAFDQIAAGCLLFFAVRWSTDNGLSLVWPAVLSTAIGAGFIAMVLLRTSLYHPAQRIWGPSLLALGLCLFVWGCIQFPIRSTPLTRILCLPGRLSYGMYMLHSGVLYLSRPLLMAANPWIAYSVFVFATTLVAFISFYGYEKPVNLWIRNRFLPRPQ
jgi:peptidoglycan/LPS O-acetylase OafA/YrhL